MITDNPTKSTVLVEIAHDGFVTVYGDTHIQAKVVNLPGALTTAEEVRIDEWMDSVLPLRYRDIRWPGTNIRAAGNFRQIGVDDISRVVANVNLINAIGGESKRFHNERSIQLAAIGG